MSQPMSTDTELALLRRSMAELVAKLAEAYAEAQHYNGIDDSDGHPPIIEMIRNLGESYERVAGECATLTAEHDAALARLAAVEADCAKLIADAHAFDFAHVALVRERDEARAALAAWCTLATDAVWHARDTIDYVPEYFQKKHGYDETARRLIADLEALAKGEVQRGER